MTEGTSQGLFIVVAIVIFGIFVSLSYTLFGKTLQPQVVDLFEIGIEKVPEYNENYMVKGNVTPTDESSFYFDVESQTIIRYLGTETDVVIPYEIGGIEVKHIGSRAFNMEVREGLTTIKVNINSVVFPNTVITIGNNAFSADNQPDPLKKIVLGKNLEKIGIGSFYKNGLTSVKLPEKLKIIDKYAFQYNHIQELDIPNSITEIGERSFYSLGDNLKNITIRNNKSEVVISADAFRGSNATIKYRPK